MLSRSRIFCGVAAKVQIPDLFSSSLEGNSQMSSAADESDVPSGGLELGPGTMKCQEHHDILE